MPHSTEPYEDDLDDLPSPRPVHYAEQSLLGALLLNPHQLPDIRALRAEHFGNHAHGALFQAMRMVPLPDPEAHRSDPAWLNAVLDAARPHAPGLTTSYLHTLVQICPRPQHAPTYARMIQSDHARRTLLMHAQRLAQTATDATLPNRAVATLAQADALSQFLDTLAGQFTPHPGSLPRTALPIHPTAGSSEEVLDEERLLLATATAHPAALKDMRWLQPEDFTQPLHAALWQCLTSLVHRAEPVDPVTVLWEAQHRGLLAGGLSAGDLMALVSEPAGSADYWGERLLQRALLARAGDVAARIATYAEDPANTTHQLITGSRRALADLAALRTRWQRSTAPTPPTAPRTSRGPSVSRAGPPPRTSPARALR
ncbi:DnaB-like helicase N-terminal domain-containing protein [Streptomyces sp. CB02460]|uniref:DnaB-like helicase N-terminal domain-containing protein n=1 Tax=Streptomyces sp. CB02460 TaxID=1703941 RepID=UPI00093B4CC8|nr:DnaB-like helicase N-terminal domain-containing protein [Streptomyces sp. CB02460]OKJ72211.1 replicative DNA helicase [Streptomyces sp. CB02460]